MGSSSYAVAMHPMKIKPSSRGDICTPVIIAALFTIAHILKQVLHPSTEKWVKKIMVYTFNGILSILKKKNKEIQPLAATGINLRALL